MSSHQPINTVFGGTRIGNRHIFTPNNGLEQFLSILAMHKVAAIDTAQSYGNSESTIGQISAGDKFAIDTKWSPPSWNEAPAWATKEQIMESAKDSMRKLGVTQVDADCCFKVNIFYLHRPDPKTPISETLCAVNNVYVNGVFRRFGLSGFPPSEVEAIYVHCLEMGYPLPTVYQGSYNPLNRNKEMGLFLTLRKLGISFYAYGPSAGGFLGKSIAQTKMMAENSTAVSATCRPYLGSTKFSEALAKWNIVADSEGVGGAELAYRWIAYHSPLDRDNGDALIIGASFPEQLEETLNGIEKGPLSDHAVSHVEEIWENIKDES